MWTKIRDRLYRMCDILELLMGVAVIIGIGIAVIALIPHVGELWLHRGEAGALYEFLEYVFNIVIGIEFMKMLCKPDGDTIIEVLIFLVARHMIIGTTSTLDDLLSIISMGILFLIKKYTK